MHGHMNVKCGVIKIGQFCGWRSWLRTAVVSRDLSMQVIWTSFILFTHRPAWTRVYPTYTTRKDGGMEIQLQALLISPHDAGKWPASQSCRLNQHLAPTGQRARSVAQPDWAPRVKKGTDSCPYRKSKRQFFCCPLGSLVNIEVSYPESPIPIHVNKAYKHKILY